MRKTCALYTTEDLRKILAPSNAFRFIHTYIYSYGKLSRLISAHIKPYKAIPIRNNYMHTWKDNIHTHGTPTQKDIHGTIAWSSIRKNRAQFIARNTRNNSMTEQSYDCTHMEKYHMEHTNMENHLYHSPYSCLHLYGRNTYIHIYIYTYGKLSYDYLRLYTHSYRTFICG